MSLVRARIMQSLWLTVIVIIPQNFSGKPKYCNTEGSNVTATNNIYTCLLVNNNRNSFQLVTKRPICLGVFALHLFRKMTIIMRQITVPLTTN